MINAHQLFDALLWWRRARELRAAFRLTFSGDDGPTLQQKTVLAFLRDLCDADTTTVRYDKDGKVDPYASAIAQGRQEVWQRISFYLHLDDAELVEIDRQNTEEMRRMTTRTRKEFYDA